MKILLSIILLLFSSIAVLFTVLISNQSFVNLTDKNYDSVVYVIDPNLFDIKVDRDYKNMSIERRNPQGILTINLEDSDNLAIIKSVFDTSWTKLEDGDNIRLIPSSTCENLALKYDDKGNFETLFCKIL